MDFTHCSLPRPAYTVVKIYSLLLLCVCARTCAPFCATAHFDVSAWVSMLCVVSCHYLLSPVSGLTVLTEDLLERNEVPLLVRNEVPSGGLSIVPWRPQPAHQMCTLTPGCTFVLQPYLISFFILLFETRSHSVS